MQTSMKWVGDFASNEKRKRDHAKPSLSLRALRQDIINYVGEAHRVWSPRVDIHRSLSADGLHERLLRRGDVAVVDRDEFDLDLDIARVVGWRTGRIADIHHLLAVRRDVGKPVFKSIAHDHLGLRIVGTCAI